MGRHLNHTGMWLIMDNQHGPGWWAHHVHFAWDGVPDRLSCSWDRLKRQPVWCCSHGFWHVYQFVVGVALVLLATEIPS